MIYRQIFKWVIFCVLETKQFFHKYRPEKPIFVITLVEDVLCIKPLNSSSNAGDIPKTYLTLEQIPILKR